MYRATVNKPQVTILTSWWTLQWCQRNKEIGTANGNYTHWPEPANSNYTLTLSQWNTPPPCPTAQEKRGQHRKRGETKTMQKKPWIQSDLLSYSNPWSTVYLLIDSSSAMDCYLLKTHHIVPTPAWSQTQAYSTLSHCVQYCVYTCRGARLNTFSTESEKEVR